MSDRISMIVEEFKFQLSPETYKRICQDIQYNEWGIAFELLCSEIYDESMPITRLQFNTLFRIGIEMGVNENKYLFLKNLIIKQ